MRNSSILKWAQNNKNSSKFSGGSSKSKEEKKWIHSPEALLHGHVVYLVKFLGSTEVDKPKGIDVVKQGIQKLKFNQQLRKSEGNRTPKVELTISVDGVAIQEPKTKRMLHQYQLHKISYCADDKAEKRFFSFIAKEGESNAHTCFVFVSDKLAEEITLTIGQAFELAYKKFLDTSGKDLETKKQLLVLQKRVAILEGENGELKNRLKDVANIKGSGDIAEYMKRKNIADICEVRVTPTITPPSEDPHQITIVHHQQPQEERSGNKTSLDELICLDTEHNTSSLSSSSSAAATAAAAAAAKLDNFTLDDLNDDDFNPRASSSSSDEDDNNHDEFNPRCSSSAPSAPVPVLNPLASVPPRDPAKIGNYQQNLAGNSIIFPKDDPFAKNPFGGGAGGAGGASDPFGMATFESSSSTSVGLIPIKSASVGGGVFSLDELDPLK